MQHIPFNEAERKLRDYSHKFPALLEKTYHILELDEILSDAFQAEVSNTSHFHEDAFILSDLDCGFIRHLRYLPAFYHSHDFFEIVYVQQGTCVNFINDEIIHLQAGDFCFLSPETVHALRACSDEDLVYNIVIRQTTFTQYFLGLFTEADILSQFFQHVIYHNEEFPYLIFHTAGDDVLANLISRSNREFEQKSRFKKQYLNALLAEFFALLLRNHEKDVYIPASSKNGGDNLVYILHYMEEHYDTISLGDLASFFGYSERQIQRIIQKATGKSFMENIQLHRIRRAENLLLKSKLTIEEIALQVGYSSSNNFRRIFYKYHQMMPNEYREQFTLH